jgi:hypothetical protein
VAHDRCPPRPPFARGVRARVAGAADARRRGRSLAEIAASAPFLVILAGALSLVFAFGWDVGAGVRHLHLAVTHLIAGRC